MNLKKEVKNMMINLEKLTVIREEEVPKKCFGYDEEMAGIDICAYTGCICNCCLFKEQ